MSGRLPPSAACDPWHIDPQPQVSAAVDDDGPPPGRGWRAVVANDRGQLPVSFSRSAASASSEASVPVVSGAVEV